MPQVYTATQGFAAEDRNGAKVHVRAGDTVHEGHWLTVTYPAWFRSQDVTHPAEERSSAASSETHSRRTGRLSKTVDVDD